MQLLQATSLLLKHLVTFLYLEVLKIATTLGMCQRDVVLSRFSLGWLHSLILSTNLYLMFLSKALKYVLYMLVGVPKMTKHLLKPLFFFQITLPLSAYIVLIIDTQQFYPLKFLKSTIRHTIPV
jgi:hypothetical protein